MHKNVKYTLLLLVVALAAAIGACTRHPYGLFASIQRERRIPFDRNLGKELTVGAFAKAGTTYFAATGALSYRDQDDPATGEKPEWEATPAPSVDGQPYRTMSLVAADVGAGQRIYAVFVSPDAARSAVYAIDPAAPATAPEEIWDLPTGIRRIDEIFALNDGTEWLIASAATTDTPAKHRLYASNDGETFVPLPGTTLDNARWIGVATNGTDVAYVSTTGVMRHSGGLDEDIAPVDASPAVDAAPARDADAIFTAVLYDETGDLLWLADSAGRLYTSDDFGTSWQRGEVNPVSATNEDPIWFSALAAVPKGPQTIIIAGTRGHGYRNVGVAGEVDATTEVSSPDVPGSNYQGSNLPSAAIEVIFVDPDRVTGFPVETADGMEEWDGHLLFMGTAQKGLWRTLSSDSGPKQWVRE